jgi:hypothetical protein
LTRTRRPDRTPEPTVEPKPTQTHEADAQRPFVQLRDKVIEHVREVRRPPAAPPRPVFPPKGWRP